MQSSQSYIFMTYQDYSTAMDIVNSGLPILFMLNEWHQNFYGRFVDFLMFYVVLKVYHISHSNGEGVLRKCSNEDDKSQRLIGCYNNFSWTYHDVFKVLFTFVQDEFVRLIKRIMLTIQHLRKC